MTASASVPLPPGVGRYPLVDVLEAEITATAATSLHPQVHQMVQVFLKYLREPRFQAPLTMPQLSQLFALWNRDLALVVIGLYTLSNSLKKLLIAQLEYINAHPKVFDYLLAIANYSALLIKLLKRHDADALYQLRVFNFYKFYTVWAQIRQAQHVLYTLVLGDAVTPLARMKRALKEQRDDALSVQSEDDTLYAKVLRFDQRDIIHQEFFDEKIAILRQHKLPWTAFIHLETSDQHDKLDKFFSEVTDDDIAALQTQLDVMAAAKTPSTKLLAVVGLNRQLVELLRHHGFANAEINNDILLPVLIYLVVTRLEPQDLVLNFHFIKNLGYQLDPYRIELYLVPGVLLSLTTYQPQDKINKSQLHKHRLQNLFELCNMHPEVDADTPEPAVAVDLEFEFCPTTAALISFITDNYLNNGELMYYLTNLEALVMFLSNVTIDELSDKPPELTSPLMVHPISKLVEDDMMLHFAFPKGTLAEEELANGTLLPKKSPRLSPNRLRSLSLMQSITNRIGDATTRILNENGSLSRQNLNPNRELQGSNDFGPRDLPMKELFPLLTNDGDLGVLLVLSENLNQDDTLLFLMMRSFLGRLNSVSQFLLAQESSVGPPRLSPLHSRTRSLLYEPNGKRNTITKFALGMTEFMTKFNNPVHPLHDDVTEILGLEGLDSSLTTIRPQPTRARTNLSFQVMDKWLQNLATPALPMKTQENSAKPSVSELTRFRGTDFELLLIADLKAMKRYYDFMCGELAVDESAEDLGV